jgi:hypothetical protein
MSHRKPYMDLTTTERDAIHQWLDDHGVDHRHVPADTQFTYDDEAQLWTVDTFKVNAEGKHYLDGANTIARETVQFAETRPLPWPMQEPQTWRCPTLGCAYRGATPTEVLAHNQSLACPTRPTRGDATAKRESTDPASGQE